MLYTQCNKSEIAVAGFASSRTADDYDIVTVIKWDIKLFLTGLMQFHVDKCGTADIV